MFNILNYICQLTSFQFTHIIISVILGIDKVEGTYLVDTIQDFLRELGMKPRTYAAIANHHFFTIPSDLSKLLRTSVEPVHVLVKK